MANPFWRPGVQFIVVLGIVSVLTIVVIVKISRSVSLFWALAPSPWWVEEGQQIMLGHILGFVRR